MIEEYTAAGLGFPAAQTVAEVIKMHAAASPEAPAIVLPNRAILTYDALQRQIDGIGAELKRAGIDAGSRIAVVLPDGPELAVAIAGVACHSTAVPLNPNLTGAELDDLFESQRLEAVILSDWVDSPAREIAKRRNVCQLEAIRWEGGVRLACRTPALPSLTEGRSVAPDDPAFILRTSGTMARPKLVPVTHRNLLARTARRQDWFALVPGDRVLCAAPLYYALGLESTLFAPLIIGASLACPSRSSEADFLTWLSELEVTWYSAGPTLHRSVLESALARGQVGFRHSLRFISSGGAPLPDAVRDGLEKFFGVPVLSCYGLSETGPVAYNSTDPKRRKRGTVGKPWPGEFAIRADDGRILVPGEIGEIVVRGPGVTPGYIDDPEANRAVFTDGWFRTGDVGRIDSDGFLIVVGRFKELINRGGEKIAPVEIDEALLRHPAVAEAAAFPVPHPRLGEDAVAAVVLRGEEIVTSLELRRFLLTTLAPFKIPRRIHIVAALPKGETGKVRRQELSRMFGAQSIDQHVPDFGSSLEVEIAEIWQRLLGRKNIGQDDDFFEMGGDSILATQMLFELERLTGRVLPDTILFETATIRQLAESVVEKDRETDAGLLVQLQPGNGHPPFFFIDGDFWGGGFYARRIAQFLGPEYPFYDLRSHGLYTDNIPTIEQMATDYMALVLAAQPHGPYRLGGHCNGALIAWELARQLVASGRRVEMVAMIEPISLNARASIRLVANALDGALKLVVPNPKRRQARVSSAVSLIWRKVQYVDKRLYERKRKPDNSGDALGVRIEKRNGELAVRLQRLMEEYDREMVLYIPSPVATDILYFVSESNVQRADVAGHVWRNLTPHLEIVVLPGDHFTCITTHAETLVNHLRARLSALDCNRDPD
jgi:oxalate---CoA ligase